MKQQYFPKENSQINLLRCAGTFSGLFFLCYFGRLRAVPIFPLEFVVPRNAGARKPRRAKTKEEKEKKNREFFLAWVSAHPAFAVSFPWLDELKKKNRGCSLFIFLEVYISL